MNVKLAVPFYKQDTNYTCGPVALQMVLDFFGVFKSEEKLTKMAKTNEKEGTSHRNILRTARKSGFVCYSKSNAKIAEIKEIISTKLPVIVNYIEPADDWGHYAVVVGIKKDTLILNDPWNGEGFEISEEEFLHRWRSGDGRAIRWMMIITGPKKHQLILRGLKNSIKKVFHRTLSK